jgi:ribosomal protein L37E
MMHHECVNCGEQYEYLPELCSTCSFSKFQAVVNGESVSQPEDHTQPNLHHCKNCGFALDLSLTRTQCQTCHFPIEHTQLSKHEGGFNEATFKNQDSP